MGTDYQPRSVLASCQRRLNVYAEMIDPKQGEPGQVVWYPTPGLHVLAHTPNGQPIRGLYRATNGELYCCAGFDIYFIDKDWTFQHIGTLHTTKVLNPVKFSDNGISVVLCDGTPVNGFSINMKTKMGLDPLFNPGVGDSLTPSSTGFMGSTYLDYSDGFFIANSIGTPSFYISNPNDTIFDPTQFAAKTASPDAIQAAIALHRVVFLIGQISTEVWYNSGGGSLPGQTFPYEVMPGVVVDFGCVAQYSIAKAENAIYWLGRNFIGETVVLRGSGYKADRISNHGLETQLGTYTRIDDAIGYTFLANGHSFYVMTFPTENVTWMFDAATSHWQQLSSFDENGSEARHRSTMHAFAYDTHVVNDFATDALYALDFKDYRDNGLPTKRLVSFPRMIDHESGKRVVFHSFTAELDSGETLVPDDNDVIMLSWSDDKGRTWSNGIPMSLGKVGQFNRLIRWQRLGISRNRVFRLEWSTAGLVALQGAFVEVVPAAT